MSMWFLSLPWLVGLNDPALPVSCGVGHRHGLDPALLWLWPAATAPIRPLAWEPPYATSAALKSKKKKLWLEELKFYAFHNRISWSNKLLIHNVLVFHY